MRAFGHRFAMIWTREHNTKIVGKGRLHLNVLWDEHWVVQEWLSEAAAACGFGEIVSISRIWPDKANSGSDANRYATKCLRYASKDLAGQADWPKGTRRWGASRAARVQMKRPDKNPDWFFSLGEPPSNFLPGDLSRYRRPTPEELRSRGYPCVCADFVACPCGGFEAAGAPRIPLTREERRQRYQPPREPTAA